MPEFQSRYNRKKGDVTPVGDASMVQRQFAGDVDINTIANKYFVTRDPAIIAPRGDIANIYGNFVEANDYQSALDAVIRADDEFMALPSELRARFHNNPAELLEFLGNEVNRDEAERLGLISPRGDQDDIGVPQPRSAEEKINKPADDESA